mmetsp:Transcript_18016/g.46453  ORF Transcript_18016/g.46453 Transcript_18016/m.46453 type:complete len:227 (-) Transcript_18016:530-1210(-)
MMLLDVLERGLNEVEVDPGVVHPRQGPQRLLVILRGVSALRLIVTLPVVVIVHVGRDLLLLALLARDLEGLLLAPAPCPAALGEVAVLVADIARHLDDVLHPERIHGESAAGDRDHGHVGSEVAHKLLDLHRGRHETDADVGPRGTDLPQQEDQQVAVSTALVHLIDEDVRHLRQRLHARLQLLQQDADRAEEQPRGVRDLFLHADLVANKRATRARAAGGVPHLL